MKGGFERGMGGAGRGAFHAPPSGSVLRGFYGFALSTEEVDSMSSGRDIVLLFTYHGQIMHR